MSPTDRAGGHSLNDVARRLAPHLRIIQASQPTPLLRDHNVVALAPDGASARRAVLALEAIEPADDQLGTVVMGAVAGPGDVSDDDNGRVDPEGVGRQVLPRVVGGALIGAVGGAIVVGVGALLLGATGWELVGAAAIGAMLLGVFGAIWLTFAGFGGSDAYRQTFVDESTSELTIVSVHTDDSARAAAARERLAGDGDLRILAVDRLGHINSALPPSRHTQQETTTMTDGSRQRDDLIEAGDAVPGEPAPEFTTVASTGKVLSLDDFTGLVPVVLTFVGTMSTDAADEVITAFNDQFAEFGRQRVQLLIVTPESEDAIRTRRRLGTTVPLLSDEDGSLLERFASSATFPATVVINQSGTVTRVLEGGAPRDHVTAVREVTIEQSGEEAG